MPLPLFSVTTIGRDASSFAARHGCGSTVAVAGTCDIFVTFHPTTVGDKVAQVRVVAGNGVVPRDRPVLGTGVP